MRPFVRNPNVAKRAKSAVRLVWRHYGREEGKIRLDRCSPVRKEGHDLSPERGKREEKSPRQAPPEVRSVERGRQRGLALQSMPQFGPELTVTAEKLERRRRRNREPCCN